MTAPAGTHGVLDVDHALTFGLHQVGTLEHPAGSNWHACWARFVRETGIHVEKWAPHARPWCGAFVWWVALIGGLRLPARWISVQAMEDDARAAGWWADGARDVRRGDLLVLFGHGVHVCWALSDGGSGMVHTLEGNTSSGTAGSQNDGGGVFMRYRPTFSVIGRVRLPQSHPLNVATAANVHAAVQTARTSAFWPLRIGSHGPEVRHLQGELVALGNPGLPVDGDYGPHTAAVVRLAQTHRGLAPTGEVDAALWHLLWR